MVSLLSWNTRLATLQCLRDLQALAHPPCAVLLIDQGSVDGTVAAVRAAFPQVQVIESPTNTGYAEGHRLALQAARHSGAQALWLLNCDVRLEPDCLDALLHAWAQHGEGLYSVLPLARDPDGSVRVDWPSKYLQAAAGLPLWQRDSRLDAAEFPPDRAPLPVAVGAGCGLLVPLAVVARCGWMDPAWFLYCEETDWCLRLRGQGVATWLVPAARLWHQGSASQQDQPGVVAVVSYYRTRNEIQLYRRERGRLAASVVALRKLLRLAWTAVQCPPQLGPQWRGLRDGWRGRMGKTLAPEAAWVPPPSSAQAPVWGRMHRLARAGVHLLRRWRESWLHTRRIGLHRLRHTHPHPMLAAWQALIAHHLTAALRSTPAPLQVVLGSLRTPRARQRRTLHVLLQYEHTLVRPGARDSAGAVPGTTPLLDDDGHYAVRVLDLPRLLQADAVIDYSAANLAHLRDSGQHPDLLRRCLWVPPLLWPYRPHSGYRDVEVLSLCYPASSPRRAAWLDQARARGLSVRNLAGIFDAHALQRWYGASRVLINIHQTADHHTLEDLRVLPALLSGCLVVSEDVPLKSAIPYADFVHWAPYGRLHDTVAAVLADYPAQWQRMHGDGRLAQVLAALELQSQQALQDWITHAACALPAVG